MTEPVSAKRTVNPVANASWSYEPKPCI